MSNEINELINKYIESFLDKFDKFSKQAELAEILLSSYKLRYDRINQKIHMTNDFLDMERKRRDVTDTNYDRIIKLEARISNLEIKSKQLLEKIKNLHLKNTNIVV